MPSLTAPLGLQKTPMEQDEFSHEGSMGQRFYQSQKHSIIRNEINMPIPYWDKVSTITVKCESDLWKITAGWKLSNEWSFLWCLCGWTPFQSAAWRKISRVPYWAYGHAKEITFVPPLSCPCCWIIFKIHKWCPMWWSHIDQIWGYF